MPKTQATTETLDDRDRLIVECVNSAERPVAAADLATITDIPYPTIRRRVRRLIDLRLLGRSTPQGPLHTITRKRDK